MIRSRFRLGLLAVPLVFCLIAGLFAVREIPRWDREIRQKFDGKRWSLPAVVYARPLELYPGLRLSPDMLEKEMLLAGYRRENEVDTAGGYSREANTVRLITRAFTFPSGPETSKDVTVHFAGGLIADMTSTRTGEPLPNVRLDPARIGSFHPLKNEDRIVLTAAEVPDLLKKSLMAVEDRDFLTHHGVSPKGILRALWADLKAGGAVQGGSTLTQQLVKNLFLGRQRTLARKLQEAVMAVLLERHYTKEQILTAYVNEVFLGQDGSRAIHGFGLASRFYFRRALGDLSAAQIATLVGMVRGPSAYDPRRHPELCTKRRNVVLRIMLARHVISQQAYATAEKQPLTDVAVQKNGFNRFPAFLDLVRHQLKDEYKENDLKTNGLQILTTLDPEVQWQVEKQLRDTLPILEKRTGRDDLEGAVIVTGRENGEVEAVAGGRKPLEHGFNRALDAHRSIGSLVKPAIYLTALGDGYTLASPLQDTAIELDTGNKRWRPQNYERIQHGRVALYQALAHSYNLATVHLGAQLGVPKVIATLRSLGYGQPLHPYPSLLLGALSLSPLEVAQVYQTIASGGFFLPLRSISSVMAANGHLLKRYGLNVKQRFPADRMYLLNHALQRVMSEGTGHRLALAAERGFAGKTGTTNDLRDSWFAGYSGHRLAVVWLGRDDDTTTGLTGASGSLVVWGGIMKALDASPLVWPEPAGISWHRIDTETLQPALPFDFHSTRLPFIGGEVQQPDQFRHNLDASLQAIRKSTGQILDALHGLVK